MIRDKIVDKLNDFLAEYYYSGIYGPIAVIIIIALLFLFVIGICGRQEERKKKEKIKKEIEKLESNNMEMDVEQFFKIRSQIIGHPPVKEYADRFDCTGMYILHNKTNDRYYVGQSENVLKRVNQHFSGSGGNADVYADYKYGNE